jgi:hypothetical protein
MEATSSDSLYQILSSVKGKWQVGLEPNFAVGGVAYYFDHGT